MAYVSLPSSSELVIHVLLMSAGVEMVKEKTGWIIAFMKCENVFRQRPMNLFKYPTVQDNIFTTYIKPTIAIRITQPLIFSTWSYCFAVLQHA